MGGNSAGGLKGMFDPGGVMFKPKVETPTVTTQDPTAAANAAANAAAAAANAKAASRRKKGSLLASGSAGVDGTGNSVLASASGKNSLGA